MIGQPSAPALGAGDSSSLHVLTAWSNLHALGRMLYITCSTPHALSGDPATSLSGLQHVNSCVCNTEEP